MESLLALRLRIGKKRFGTLGPRIVRIGRRRVTKGPCRPTELEALEYVAKHTSIPVPRIHRSYYHHGRLYLELEYVRGVSLLEAWTKGLLNEDQKRSIVKELAGYINELRGLDPPRQGAVGSALLDACYDGRIGSALVGPFDTCDEFHSFLRTHVPLDLCRKMFREQVADCHSRRYRTVFTHADLALRNIVVRDGKIAAIVDWEFAGWYPEYWEYTKAHFVRMDIPDWYDMLEDAMTRYDAELIAERTLWRLCESPGDVLRGQSR